MLARVLMVALLVVVPAGVSAQSTLAIGKGSYFHIPTLDVRLDIPAGAMPIEVVPVTRTQWALRVAAASVDLPPWQLDGRTQVTISMPNDAEGACYFRGSVARCALKARFLINSGRGRPQFVDLVFTTAQASRTVAGKTAVATGKGFDARTSEIQLVAASETPPGAAVKASQPFSVVLNGHLTNPPKR